MSADSTRYRLKLVMKTSAEGLPCFDDGTGLATVDGISDNEHRWAVLHPTTRHPVTGIPSLATSPAALILIASKPLSNRRLPIASLVDVDKDKRRSGNVTCRRAERP